MKKRMLMFAWVLSVVNSAWSGPVGEQQARQKAVAFMTGKATTRGANTLTRVYLPLQTKSASWSVSDAPIYVYNLEGGGYVIVSGDDRTADILGFSEKGSLDANRLPANMKSWLQSYVRKIESIPASAMPRRKAITRSAAKTAIATKLKTEWGQDYPYNLHTPDLRIKWNLKDTTVHAATGCVATAMGMIMNYYRYPSKLFKALPGYEGTSDIPVLDSDTGEQDTVKNVKWKTEDIAANTTIDWSNIKDKYNQKSKDIEIEAVARLMQYCGSAVDMAYGLESSTDNGSMMKGLSEVFGYNDVYMLNDFEYDDQGWVDAVYHEMSKAGPVLFGGQTPTQGGHQFILDGYEAKDGKDYFWANWGWDGDANGYMLLSVMEPGWIINDEGEAEGFIENQDLLCGLGDDGKGFTTIPNNLFYAYEMELGEEDKQYSRSSESEAFGVTDYFVRFGNIHLLEQTLQCSVGVYDASNNLVGLTKMSDEKGKALEFMYYTYVEPDETKKGDSFPIGKGLGDGVYTVKLICAEPNTDDWVSMQNAETLALKMTVSGNKCSFKYNGSATAIQKVTAETSANTDNAWYSLSGVRLDSKPTAHGIYIHQGHKVVVR